jgi:hypothetical protein
MKRCCLHESGGPGGTSPMPQVRSGSCCLFAETAERNPATRKIQFQVTLGNLRSSLVISTLGGPPELITSPAFHRPPTAQVQPQKLCTSPLAPNHELSAISRRAPGAGVKKCKIVQNRALRSVLAFVSPPRSCPLRSGGVLAGRAAAQSSKNRKALRFQLVLDRFFRRPKTLPGKVQSLTKSAQFYNVSIYVQLTYTNDP